MNTIDLQRVFIEANGCHPCRDEGIRSLARSLACLRVGLLLGVILACASDEFRGKSAGGLYGDAVEEIDYNTGRILD